jgi:polysaccharide export outer membrane protein
MRTYLFLTVLLAGCVRLPQAPTHLSDDPDFEPPVVVTPPGIADDPAVEFRLSPGDSVMLRTISATVHEYPGLFVDELGLLHVPLAGDVPVNGLSLIEAERAIEAAIQTFDRAARVNVVLATQGGHMATVLGAVREPGRVMVTPGMRVADLLASVGGPVVASSAIDPTEAADLLGAQLVRAGVPVPISLELGVRGDPMHNVRVRPGDHLYVPATRGRTVTVLGEVRTPGILGYRSGIQLTAALALAGGLSPDAHRRDIRVVRGTLDAPRVFRTSLRALVNGHGHDVELAPGDIVFVTRTGLANVRDVMLALQPLLFAAQNIGLGIGISRAR